MFASAQFGRAHAKTYSDLYSVRFEHHRFVLDVTSFMQEHICWAQLRSQYNWLKKCLSGSEYCSSSIGIISEFQDCQEWQEMPCNAQVPNRKERKQFDITCCTTLLYYLILHTIIQFAEPITILVSQPRSIISPPPMHKHKGSQALRMLPPKFVRHSDDQTSGQQLCKQLQPINPHVSTRQWKLQAKQNVSSWGSKQFSHLL